jgi:hypothetical protein
MLPFVHPSLFWIGLPLIGLPILIHLINLLRQRKVEWAAMEFLLASQKKHRKWIILKQLLLLLMRMMAVTALVLMVAQPVLKNQWGALFGGSNTHHIVLLDDSFSMSDRWADTSAFAQAKQVVERLAARATRQETPQTFTLLRFSRAGRTSGGTQPDLMNESVTADFSTKLEGTLGPLAVSQTAAGPAEAIDAVERLPAAREDETRIVYLVSDFRAVEWNEPTVLKKSLEKLSAGDAQLHLVNCVDTGRGNLAIAQLQTAPGVRAANVPLMVDVAVINHGTSAIKNVSVLLEEDGNTRPAVVIEEIPAGKTVSRRFPVIFPTAGAHLLKAQLESDAVDFDNLRFSVVEVSATTPVLVIDGSPDGRDGYFLATALAPGGKIHSGIKPLIESPRYLRNNPLDGFAAIYLANIERLDPAEIEALESYVRAGGGVAFFLGERSTSDFFNKQLYRNGEGLFPLPLAQSVQLLVDRLEKVPDVEVTDHPIFSVFAGERNSFISAVIIERYFAAPKGWQADPDSTTKVIAKVRNGAPLVVEHKFGAGRVIAFLTKAAPTETDQGVWNNWARGNPSFVVAMLELEAYLAGARQTSAPRLVGTPLELKLDAGKYRPQVRFTLPSDGATASRKDGGVLTIDAEQAKNSLLAAFNETHASGFYDAQLTKVDGSTETRRFAINVDPAEGNLRHIDGPQLAVRLSGINYEFHNAGDFAFNARQLAGFNLGASLLYALVIILLLEQVLAYFTSYHRKPLGGARR